MELPGKHGHRERTLAAGGEHSGERRHGLEPRGAQDPDVLHTFMRRVPAAWKLRHPLLLNRTEEWQKECLFQVQISVDMLLSKCIMEFADRKKIYAPEWVAEADKIYVVLAVFLAAGAPRKDPKNPETPGCGEWVRRLHVKCTSGERGVSPLPVFSIFARYLVRCLLEEDVPAAQDERQRARGGVHSSEQRASS
eukprot:270306-Prymnesium_polylepis.1